MASDQTYLSIPEAAARLRDAGLNVSVASVRRWVRVGKLPAVPLPNGRAQIHHTHVDALLPKTPAEPPAQPTVPEFATP